MINNYIIFIIVIFIIIFICFLCYFKTYKGNDTKKNKLENIKNNINMKEKNKLYNNLKRKINDTIIKKYTLQTIKDNPKLKSNFESITECILNKILKNIDIENAYFIINDNFEILYNEVHKKDPTIYNCFNEKQLKAIKFLRDRISNTDIDSIIDYVKKNINIDFTNCKDNNCFSEKEYRILNNYS